MHTVKPGERYGQLTVIAQHPERLHKGIAWLCRCDCGETTVATTTHLASGSKKSCGCLRRKTPANALDLAGRKFGKLTAIERAGITKSGTALWKCACDCGNPFVANATQLRSGDTVSCGCERPMKAEAARSILTDEYTVDGVQVPLLTKKVRSDSKTGAKGVHKRERHGKVTYEASITVKGKRIYGGTYAEESDAIAARKRLEADYHAPYIEALKERNGNNGIND